MTKQWLKTSFLIFLWFGGLNLQDVSANEVQTATKTEIEACQKPFLRSPEELLNLVGEKWASSLLSPPFRSSDRRRYFLYALNKSPRVHGMMNMLADHRQKVKPTQYGEIRERTQLFSDELVYFLLYASGWSYTGVVFGPMIDDNWFGPNYIGFIGDQNLASIDDKLYTMIGHISRDVFDAQIYKDIYPSFVRELQRFPDHLNPPTEGPRRAENVLDQLGMKPDDFPRYISQIRIHTLMGMHIDFLRQAHRSIFGSQQQKPSFVFNDYVPSDVVASLKQPEILPSDLNFIAEELKRRYRPTGIRSEDDFDFHHFMDLYRRYIELDVGYIL